MEWQVKLDVWLQVNRLLNTYVNAIFNVLLMERF